MDSTTSPCEDVVVQLTETDKETSKEELGRELVGVNTRAARGPAVHGADYQRTDELNAGSQRHVDRRPKPTSFYRHRCVVVCTNIQLLVIFTYFFFSSFFFFFLSGNAVLQLHSYTLMFSLVAMLLCVVLFAP